MILANFNVDCNIANTVIEDMRQVGEWSTKTPETIAVSGVLKFLKDNRLSLGVFALAFHNVLYR